MADAHENGHIFKDGVRQSYYSHASAKMNENGYHNSHCPDKPPWRPVENPAECFAVKTNGIKSAETRSNVLSGRDSSSMSPAPAFHYRQGSDKENALSSANITANGASSLMTMDEKRGDHIIRPDYLERSTQQTERKEDRFENTAKLTNQKASLDFCNLKLDVAATESLLENGTALLMSRKELKTAQKQIYLPVQSKGSNSTRAELASREQSIVKESVVEDSDVALSIKSRDNQEIVSQSFKSAKEESLKAFPSSPTKEIHDSVTVKPTKPMFRHGKEAARSLQKDTQNYVIDNTSMQSPKDNLNLSTSRYISRNSSEYTDDGDPFSTPESVYIDVKTCGTRGFDTAYEMSMKLNPNKYFTSSAPRRRRPAASPSNAIEDVQPKTRAQNFKTCRYCNADLSKYRQAMHYRFYSSKLINMSVYPGPGDETQNRHRFPFLPCPRCGADLRDDVLERSDYPCFRCGGVHAHQPHTAKALQAGRQRPVGQAWAEAREDQKQQKKTNRQRPASKETLELAQQKSLERLEGEAESKEQKKQTRHQSQTEQKPKPKEPRSATRYTSTVKRIKRLNSQFIRDIFPDLQKRTYLVPPLAFNVLKRTAHDSLNIKNGFVYDSTPQSSTRADEARDRVLSAISEALPHIYKDKPAFVMSNIAFEDYLHKSVPEELSITEKQAVPLPRPDDMDPKYRRGEVDVLIFVKDYGLIILDIKAVGDTLAEIHASDEEEVKVINGVLEKSLHQMRKEKEVIMHLVSDINTCTIPLTCVLVLPNLKRHQLTKALAGSPDLRKELQACFRKLGDAETVCLCADDLPSKHQPVSLADLKKIMDWWTRNFPVQSTIASQVTDEAYEDIVGRFCGNLSTISVWTPETPRAEVRTLGQAVNETARRFSTLVLTQKQLQILDSQDHLVFLHGPPGSGKTLLLVLKAAHWLKGGNYVCILSLCQGPSPSALVMEHQIKQTLAQFKEQTTPPSGDDLDLQTVLEPDSSSVTESSMRLVRRLRDRAGGRPMLLIMDDLQAQGREVMSALKRVLTYSLTSEKAEPGQACAIWCAGAWARNCPPSFESKNLSVALRCPPAVQTVLKLVEPSPSAEEPSPYGAVASCGVYGSAADASQGMSESASPVSKTAETAIRTVNEIMAHVLTALSTLTLVTSQTLTPEAIKREDREPENINTIPSKEQKSSELVATAVHAAASADRSITASRSAAKQLETATAKALSVVPLALAIQPAVNTSSTESSSTLTESIVATRTVSINEIDALLRPIIEHFWLRNVGTRTPSVITPQTSASAPAIATTSTEHHYITSSTDTSHESGIPLQTTGLKVKLLDHQHHANCPVLACVTCAEHLAQYLQINLGVGRDLFPEDILILTSDTAALQNDPQPVFSQVLGQKMAVNIETVVNYDGSQKVLAFPTKGSITLTGVQFAIGLKNKVVVFIPEGNPRPAAENRHVDTKDVGKDSMCLDTEMQKKVSSADNQKDDNRDDDNKRRPISLEDADGESLKSQSNALPEDEMILSSSGEREDDKASRSSFNEVDKIYSKNAKSNVVTCNETWTMQRDSELMSHDGRLRQAVKMLSQRNRDRMWYAVSRALGHAIIFIFQNE